jgi:hypothetical protein
MHYYNEYMVMESKDMQLNGLKNDHTLDTCGAIKIFENPNMASLLLCRLNLKGSKIHFSSQTVFELKKLGYDFEQITKHIEQTVGAIIVVGEITEDMENDAEYLETVCPTLHFGDSQILAYSKATGTKLITCDRGLAEAARISNIRVVNPDLLHCNEFVANRRRSRLRGNIGRWFSKPLQSRQKVRQPKGAMA